MFDLFAIPAWVWKKYEIMRKNIGDQALAKLKGATNMEDMEGFVPITEAVKIVKDLGLRWGIQSIQQMASRDIIIKQKINGELCVSKASLLAVAEAEKYKSPPLEALMDTS